MWMFFCEKIRQRRGYRWNGDDRHVVRQFDDRERRTDGLSTCRTRPSRLQRANPQRDGTAGTRGGALLRHQQSRRVQGMQYPLLSWYFHLPTSGDYSNSIINNFLFKKLLRVWCHRCTLTVKRGAPSLNNKIWNLKIRKVHKAFAFFAIFHLVNLDFVFLRNFSKLIT